MINTCNKNNLLYSFYDYNKKMFLSNEQIEKVNSIYEIVSCPFNVPQPKNDMKKKSSSKEKINKLINKPYYSIFYKPEIIDKIRQYLSPSTIDIKYTRTIKGYPENNNSEKLYYKTNYMSKNKISSTIIIKTSKENHIFYIGDENVKIDFFNSIFDAYLIIENKNCKIKKKNNKINSKINIKNLSVSETKNKSASKSKSKSKNRSRGKK